MEVPRDGLAAHSDGRARLSCGYGRSLGHGKSIVLQPRAIQSRLLLLLLMIHGHVPCESPTTQISSSPLLSSPLPSCLSSSIEKSKNSNLFLSVETILFFLHRPNTVHGRYQRRQEAKGAPPTCFAAQVKMEIAVFLVYSTLSLFTFISSSTLLLSNNHSPRIHRF